MMHESEPAVISDLSYANLRIPNQDSQLSGISSVNGINESLPVDHFGDIIFVLTVINKRALLIIFHELRRIFNTDNLFILISNVDGAPEIHLRLLIAALVNEELPILLSFLDSIISEGF